MKKFVLGLIGALLLLTVTAQDSTKKYFAVRTIGPLPFLEYGPGDDRLGGAKMGYLDTGIVLKVIDSAGSDYIVQLATYHRAYIAKTNVIKDTLTKFRPYYLSGSWLANGFEGYDEITVGMEERLPFRSIQQISPSRIAIDLFGVTSNTNWITQKNTVKEIANLWYEQTEDDVLRLYIDLKHAQHWGHFITYDSTGKKLVIRINHPPAGKKLKDLVIAIDAGHGGANTGAAGKNSKILEKDYTLKFALALQQKLEKRKAKVIMTRTTDIDISMPDRALWLRAQQPDVLISLHLNSSANPTAKGTSTYYRYIGFRPLTQYVYQRMLQTGLNDFGNVGSFNFALSGPMEYPNCLVEIAFLSNEEDEKRILDPKFHTEVARQITKGIADWLKANK